MHALVALVTLLAVALYLWMGISVARARTRFGVSPPAMTGHDEFERHVRVHGNTLEWMVIFLPCLWLCAIFVNDAIAAALGLVWIVGRLLYMLGYRREPKARAGGFYIQALAALALFLGALAGAAWSLVRGLG
jgi:glutathione S-transferase